MALRTSPCRSEALDKGVPMERRSALSGMLSIPRGRCRVMRAPETSNAGAVEVRLRIRRASAEKGVGRAKPREEGNVEPTGKHESALPVVHVPYALTDIRHGREPRSAKRPDWPVVCRCRTGKAIEFSPRAASVSEHGRKEGSGAPIIVGWSPCG